MPEKEPKDMDLGELVERFIHIAIDAAESMSQKIYIPEKVEEIQKRYEKDVKPLKEELKHYQKIRVLPAPKPTDKKDYNLENVAEEFFDTD